MQFILSFWLESKESLFNPPDIFFSLFVFRATKGSLNLSKVLHNGVKFFLKSNFLAPTISRDFKNSLNTSMIIDPVNILSNWMLLNKIQIQLLKGFDPIVALFRDTIYDPKTQAGF